MLNAWVHAIAVERWSDIALVLNPIYFSGVECSLQSEGKALTGWECLFHEMPHLCTFESKQVRVTRSILAIRH